MKSPILILALALAILNANAQVSLIKDINQQKEQTDLETYCTFGEKLIYTTYNYDLEKYFLWVTDGNTDIRLGHCDPTIANNPVIAGKFYFTLDGDIWSTNGTVSGTQKVVAGEFDLNQWVMAGSKLIVSGYDTSHGREMWVTDFTQAGTSLLKDVSVGSGTSFPRSLFSVNGFAYFTTDPNQNSLKLWKSDGTPQGTKIVDDVYRGYACVIGEDIYYVGSIVDSYALKKYNGSATSTLKSSLNPGLSPVFNPRLVPVNDKLFFTLLNANGALEFWKSEGSVGNTSRVALLGADDFHIGGWTVAGDLVYFIYDDGIHGSERWRTDGTDNGTFLVKDVYEGPYSSSTFSQVILEGKLVFTSYDGNDTHLFVSDGTTAGTKSIQTNAGYQRIYLTRFNDAIYFINQSDGISSLWSTQGTTANTTMVKEIGEFENRFFAPISNQFLIGMRHWGGFEFWKSNGTNPGTTRAFAIGSAASSDPSFFLVFDDQLFFLASDGTHGPQVWKTDGNNALPVTDFVSQEWNGLSPIVASGEKMFLKIGSDYGLWSTTAEGMETKLAGLSGFYSYNTTKSILAIDDNVFFVGYDDDHGDELWVSNGTISGTSRVSDIAPGEASSLPGSFVALQGNLYFQSNASEIWKSDGTVNGTELIKKISEDSCSVRILGKTEDLFFFTKTTWAGISLWRSNGTTEGTFQLSEISESYDYNVSGTVLNENLFYTALSSESETLYRTDGSPGGEHVIAVFDKGTSVDAVSDLVATNDEVFFVANTTANGRELWKTKGTGTNLVMDITSGLASSNPENVTALSDSVVFTTANGDLTTFWVSNKNETYRLSGPDKLDVRSHFLPLGDKLIFSAFTLEHGIELYSVGRLITSIENHQTRILKPYPNPVQDSDYITIPLPVTHGTVKLFSTTGNCFSEVSFTESQAIIPGNSLPSGMTILKLQTANGLFTAKIVKL